MYNTYNADSKDRQTVHAETLRIRNHVGLRSVGY